MANKINYKKIKDLLEDYQFSALDNKVNDYIIRKIKQEFLKKEISSERRISLHPFTLIGLDENTAIKIVSPGPNNKLQCVKNLKEYANIDLKTAKDLIYDFFEKYPQGIK